MYVYRKDRQLAQQVLEKRLNLENVRRREMDIDEDMSAGGTRPYRNKPRPPQPGPRLYLAQPVPLPH